MSFQLLKKKIKEKKAIVGIVGLGYVGLPLAMEFAKKGIETVGFDADAEKVKKIGRGESYILDVDDTELKDVVNKNRLTPAMNFCLLRELDVIIICVPTPLTKTKEPDLHFIVEASQEIAKSIKKGQLVILRSTTYTGTTVEIVGPILETSGLRMGEDFYLAFSPERVDLGNKLFKIANTPVVVGGIDSKSTELARLLLEQVTEKVVPLSCSQAAEMTKLFENTFRSVNIALVNELSMLCERMGLDVWEIVSAAATKPFGFMPFLPGPGVGGHCIPVDPYFLSWKAKEFDFHTNFIYLAAQINENMPYYVVRRTISAIYGNGIDPKQATVLILGVAYKKDTNDWRYSPALKIIELLEKEGLNVLYHDPYVAEINIDNKVYKSSLLTEGILNRVACLLIVTDHTDLDYEWIVGNSKIVVDCRNATKDILDKFKNIIRI
ncbi:UDP-N-acetyl-D-glucosamine dehydrogenase [Candidatus Hakubella thermalkaliphila]|uniref:UDP-N-acetyl-D-glucosamine dehydrogenase n=5 Tax=Candidatus Hakubella thermalkaliphila TaxID=2754717 RepID=A0A6V8PVW3_9ACTN|nr:nucleotide sugar dehydrogenase [Candidatus Hakubella thermalkaliphila]GFP22720.1 UDP-N-acetyl-D-glucosamine dehydrogenase [Candidatus Hakubella thermalkaliphila]GFP36447.1 UDP-N-acetyl-D-glucosamine dehydrogenase [Candidatus Hakubella thermalkaliphila]GFP39751.1 UDP-N-acetyl-D-glucosamine dehydrogenase [Candidatus Hakubella thermalkaliphila]GFP41008.1 UDP-N-acetyl-D-glucosamine dehydrogenase [Candidatus Hakubella thermalkaliphila]